MSFGKKTTVIKVGYREVEAMAEKAYGLDREKYSFVAVEVCGNDEQHTFRVDGAITDFDTPTAELIRSGKDVPEYHNQLLLNCLCEDGYIEPGNYLVNVCW